MSEECELPSETLNKSDYNNKHYRIILKLFSLQKSKIISTPLINKTNNNL